MSKAKSIVSILILIVGFVAILLFLILVQVPQYTNMTSAQADAQNTRFVQGQVEACKQAGGDPQADGTTAYCNVGFQQPDTSWYITPQPNSWFEWWQMGQILLSIIAVVLMVWSIWLPYFSFFIERKKELCPKTATVSPGRETVV